MQKNHVFAVENEVQCVAGNSYECLTFYQTGVLIRIGLPNLLRNYFYLRFRYLLM